MPFPTPSVVAEFFKDGELGKDSMAYRNDPYCSFEAEEEWDERDRTSSDSEGIDERSESAESHDFQSGIQEDSDNRSSTTFNILIVPHDPN